MIDDLVKTLHEYARGEGSGSFRAVTLHHAAETIGTLSAENERLGNERDHWLKEARRTLASGQEALDRAEATESALAESEQNAMGLASDLAGTQAKLAETRERLEKPAKRLVALLQEAASARGTVSGNLRLCQSLGGACADLLAALSEAQP